MFFGSSNVDSYSSGKDIRSIQLPSVSSKEGSEEEHVHTPGVSNEIGNHSTVLFNAQLPNLVTLSLLPKSQWQSLINLDIIKVTPLFLVEKNILGSK